MKWVVGTGRCGLHNYTALYGGYIQSRQSWKNEVIKRYHGKNFDEGYVREEIKRRSKLPFPFVTDCAQFIFIDLINEIDREAKFVWLQDEKQKVVEGFMNKIGEEYRIHPLGWEFKTERKKELIEWYYDEVNKIIGEKLAGLEFEHVWNRNVRRAGQESLDLLSVYA